MKQNYYFGISPEGFHEVAYTEWGNWSEQFPSIICAHGLTRNGRDFDELAMYLSNKGRYILCPDIVGRGESAWFTNSSYYNFTQYVSDMNGLIARSGADHIDWIGTSMGGIIGMMLAALPNTPIRKLIINDVGPQIPINALKRLAQYAGKDPLFKTIEEAKIYCKNTYADFGNLSEEQWDHFTQHSIKQSASNLYKLKVDPGIKHSKPPSQWFNEFIHHPFKAMEGIFYDVDLWPIWKEIHCPILVLHGEHSDLLTPKIIAQMQRTRSDIEIYEIEGAGHAPALLDEKDHQIIYNWLVKT